MKIMEKWRDLNTKKEIKKKEKKKFKGKDVWHVGKREEASSFLKYD